MGNYSSANDKIYSREVIRNDVQAGEQDAVIFTGSGATSAVDVLVKIFRCKKYRFAVGGWMNRFVEKRKRVSKEKMLNRIERDRCNKLYHQNSLIVRQT